MKNTTGAWRARWAVGGPWLGTAARVILGGVWIAAGATKIGDLAASGRAVAAYRILPHEWATFFGGVQPFLEIALGVLLIIGLGSRIAAGVSAVLLLAFIGGIASAAARGLRIDCGCFSAGGDLAAGQSTGYTLEIVRDLALVGLAVLIIILPRTRLSLEARILGDDGGEP